MAHDQELNREVALKKMQDRAARDPGSRARFVIEAEVTGALEHPGIVPVYSLGTDTDGHPFYAMRFIRGDTLRDAIDRHHKTAGLAPGADTSALSLQRLLRRFVDVCNAIDYAHGRGVLHRDLKPANIVVGNHGETLVVDWGLAKAMGKPGPAPAMDERPVEPSSGVSSVETLEGSALGTPSYMSPEQANGDLDRMGPTSDVFSLGATLYCILTGARRSWATTPSRFWSRPGRVSFRGLAKSIIRSPRPWRPSCSKRWRMNRPIDIKRPVRSPMTSSAIWPTSR